MKRKDFLFIISSFVCWRILLFIFLGFAIKFLPLQQHYIGGGIERYLKNPWFWTWANFDGENYLSIAKYGYLFVGQAFFPLYSLIIRFFGSGMWAGLLISNLSFLIALIGLYKLIKLDYSEKITRLSILLLLLFPTSFYFGSVYTESLFLAFVVWSYYAGRKEKWLITGILGAFASATRVIGVILLPSLLIGLLIKKKKLEVKHWPLILIPLGIIFYMIYLGRFSGDFLAFIHAQVSVGEQRSSTLIILPQVFYRYLFRIIPNLNFNYLPIVFTTFLELGSALLFLILSVYSFWKLKLSYALFLSLGYLIPTLTGSFSSLPRYVLVLFPGFILLALWTEKLSRPFKIVIYGILFISLAIASGLFLRGYWVS